MPCFFLVSLPCSPLLSLHSQFKTSGSGGGNQGLLLPFHSQHARHASLRSSHRMAKLLSSSSTFSLDFLRRLLCAHSIGNAQRDAPGHLSAPEPEGRSPCIVARLMGLDAMPAAETPQAHHPQQLLRRSRSASSVEGGSQSPPRGLGDAAVRPAASLREKQVYLRAENDMFLLLSFSPEEERDIAKKAGDDDEEAERRRENRPGRKQRRAHRRKLQFGNDDDEPGRRECNNAQSSSPVSVLEARSDVHEETSTTTTSSSLEDAEPCSATSEEAQFASEQQSSSTRTSFVQLDDTSPATSTVHGASRCSDRERRRHRRTANKSDDASAPDVSGIWQPVCRLVEEDIKNVEWLTRHGASNVVVAAEMGSEILDQLLCEATAELVQLSSDVVCASPPVSSCILKQEKN